jgi:hypothetical protein
MKRAFYVIAVLLAVSWILFAFVFSAGRGTHILLLLAITCWLHAIITIPQKRFDIKGNKKEEDVEPIIGSQSA